MQYRFRDGAAGNRIAPRATFELARLELIAYQITAIDEIQLMRKMPSLDKHSKYRNMSNCPHVHLFVIFSSSKSLQYFFKVKMSTNVMAC